MTAAPVLRMDFGNLPDGALDAAAAFHAAALPAIREDAAGHRQHDLVIIFSRAGHEHRAWRLAAVQQLAREFAPRRVNAIAGDDDTAIGQALEFLASAPGVTGQVLEVDGNLSASD